MRYSVTVPEPIHSAATAHLLRCDGQEDLTFGLYAPSSGRERSTAIVQRLLLPEEGEREVHGNVSFLPPYVERALNEARRSGLGLLLMHSHDFPGWQDMSKDDVKAELSLAPRAQAATGLPFVGMTIGNDGAWSARWWRKTRPRQYEQKWCESVRVIGNKIHPTFHDDLLPPPEIGEELLRTVSAWGELTQGKLARLRVGIVGCGSVGMIVAAAIARMGVQKVTLLDFDRVKRVNLDRLFFATNVDLDRLKVEVLASHLTAASTHAGFEVLPMPYSICEKEGYTSALDCDVLFSCVDRPWPRSVLNQIAYAHCIPVVDGGIYIAALKSGGIRQADWRAHTVAPGRPCLECLGQFDPGLVSAERDGYLDDPNYIQGLPEEHPLRRKENVVAFSLGCGSLQVLQYIALVAAPSYTEPGAQRYRFVQSELTSQHDSCGPNCLYQPNAGLGDYWPVVVWGEHESAAKSREEEPLTE